MWRRLSFLVNLSNSSGASQVLLVVKNTPANAGDTGDPGWIPGWGKSPGGGNGSPGEGNGILSWEIPWTEEPDRLQSTGSQTVGQD